MWDLPLQGLVLLSGALAGLSAGLLGVGGGIIVVPALYYLFTASGMDVSLAMPMAVGTSLASIVFTSLVSASSHHRRGSVDWQRVGRWSPGIILGAVLGVWLATFVGGGLLKSLFGLFLLYVGISLWRSAHQQIGAARPWPASPWLTLIPVSVGCLSALLGVGGGLMMVPVLHHFQYHLHRAVGTAAAMGAVISLPATLSYVVTGWGLPDLPSGALGYVNGPALLLVALATVLFTPLGVRLSYYLKVPTVKQIFAGLAFIMGLRMVLF